jgi:glycosyltransferase involved in cell wall biosynthesis
MPDFLLQQDYPNFENIVIDDSSSNSTCDKNIEKICDKIVVINAGLHQMKHVIKDS